jgi:5-methylcytosine-specific restriction endonuclease McrA
VVWTMPLPFSFRQSGRRRLVSTRSKEQLLRPKKYTVDQLREAVSSSTSIRQVLSKLSIIAAGGNYATIKAAFIHYDLDTSHFTGQASNRGKVFTFRNQPLSAYLNNSKKIQSDKLRRRLIQEGLLATSCASCNLSDWLGGPIPLELDHVDGNRLNNNLSNLRLLCPNCHALTPTYRGKNIPRLRSALPVKDSPTLTPST